MNAPRRQLPQWKIDLAREGITFIESEMGSR
jgi:hypothetical protein